MNLEHLIEQTADPETTSNRLQTLLENKDAVRYFDALSDDNQTGLIHILGISRFLYHFLLRHPDTISLIGVPYLTSETPKISDVNELRIHKYRSLFQISWMDVCNTCPYESVLYSLSHLADFTLERAMSFVSKSADNFSSDIKTDIAMMALGKLGANELNYSSDVDLIFVIRNTDEKLRHEINKHYTQHIRQLCRLLEDKTDEGFLYRVDLNLRPWGRSAPLVFSLDENENYYQASKEAWERIAWLRGRFVAGSKQLGSEMITRLKPFLFHKTLSTEDVERFLKIKSDISHQREKEGHWNIKLGEGGIRDIEFFIHLLQLVNGAHYSELQKTNTLEILTQLVKFNFIKQAEYIELRDCYLFLRRLENRLQMIDEQQVHQLPKEKIKLEGIARMMGYEAESESEAYTNFNDDLLLNQQVAKKYFERLLTNESYRS
jgi:[glutamine synthetase] adenylyltransferase / [glutamine synthetase]-adenylyl-L-tyrosine phosphorylase